MQPPLVASRIRILGSSPYTFIARYHNRAPPLILRPAFIGAEYKKSMVNSPTTGDVRALPESESRLPPGKKPRLNRKKNESKRSQKRRQRESGVPEPCSPDDVLWRDVIAIVGQEAVNQASEDGTDFDSPFEYHQEVELEISSLCSSGKFSLGIDLLLESCLFLLMSARVRVTIGLRKGFLSHLFTVIESTSDFC